MNCRTKAMTISLVLHGAVISLVFALSSSLADQDKPPIVIDFTLVEPSAPPAPPNNTPPKKEDKPTIAKPIPRPIPHPKPQPTPPKQKISPPEPATEPEGIVPIVAKPKKAPPAPPEQAPVTTANSTAGGTGTAGTARSVGASRGDSTEQLSNKYRAENFAYIKKIIEQNLSYPRRAQRMGWTGRVVVSFDVAKNGHVNEIRILKSTGYELLDSNLVETIRKVEPFPRPPISVTLNIPFVYELR
ncbi:MAG: energy transducer TonB [Geobacteraceae bacterium]